MASRQKDKDQSQPGNERNLKAGHVVLLFCLLIAPGLALRRLSAFVGVWWLLGYAITISLLTYAVYGADKDSAQEKQPDWRAPEKLLHALEFAGGWPGAFLAQRSLRHKCSKVQYQIAYWLIVLLHVCAATDYLLHWPLARAVGRLLSIGGKG